MKCNSPQATKKMKMNKRDRSKTVKKSKMARKRNNNRVFQAVNRSKLMEKNKKRMKSKAKRKKKNNLQNHQRKSKY